MMRGTETGQGQPLVVVEGLVKRYPKRGSRTFSREWSTVVDHVSFTLERGTTLALVGESGSGKTTTSMMVLGLLEPTSGTIRVDGKPVAGLGQREALALRRRMQVVFQDPFASLNARLTVAETVVEGMRVHGLHGGDAARLEKAEDLLASVGLSADAMDRYPHEFSGGQRQRIAIARALSVEPEFLVLDEPTSALDVSVQAQVLNLLRKLQRERGLTYLLVTHNLGVVGYLADRVAVMEAGKIVESGAVDDIFDRPTHAVTRRLLESTPDI